MKAISVTPQLKQASLVNIHDDLLMGKANGIKNVIQLK